MNDASIPSREFDETPFNPNQPGNQQSPDENKGGFSAYANISSNEQIQRARTSIANYDSADAVRSRSLK